MGTKLSKIFGKQKKPGLLDLPDEILIKIVKELPWFKAKLGNLPLEEGPSQAETALVCKKLAQIIKSAINQK